MSWTRRRGAAGDSGIPAPDTICGIPTMNDDKLHAIFLILTIALAGALLVFLGLSIESVLSPFLILAALVYILYPLRSHPLARRTMTLGLLLFGAWFVHSLLGVLFPFIAAFLLAYIFNPVVARLERKQFPRWAGSLVVTLGSLALLVSVVLFLFPVALAQFQSLINAMGELARITVEAVKSGWLINLLAELGIPVEQAQHIIANELSPKLEGVLIALLKSVLEFLTGVSSLVLHIINLVIIPFLFFYLLKDFPLLKETFVHLLSDSVRSKTLMVLQTVDDILGRYFRGAIFVALIQGTLSALVLTLIGVNYSLVLGIMTAVLNFIPYVGLITSLVVASLVALFSGGAVGAKVIGVVVLYLSQKLLEATVLAPKIIGGRVGLHPVLLILCLVVFGYFLGFVGMLIAVPTTALLIAVAKEYQALSRKAPVDMPVEV